MGIKTRIKSLWSRTLLKLARLLAKPMNIPTLKSDHTKIDSKRVKAATIKKDSNGNLYIVLTVGEEGVDDYPLFFIYTPELHQWLRDSGVLVINEAAYLAGEPLTGIKFHTADNIPEDIFVEEYVSGFKLKLG